MDSHAGPSKALSEGTISILACNFTVDICTQDNATQGAKQLLIRSTPFVVMSTDIARWMDGTECGSRLITGGQFTDIMVEGEQ